jgi:hypothetical protein
MASRSEAKGTTVAARPAFARGKGRKSLPALLSRRESLLEGSVLLLPRAINEKPANQPGSRSGNRTEPGIPADRAKNGADTGTRRSAGQGALLGWGHIGAGREQHGDGHEQQ